MNDDIYFNPDATLKELRTYFWQEWEARVDYHRRYLAGEFVPRGVTMARDGRGYAANREALREAENWAREWKKRVDEE